MACIAALYSFLLILHVSLLLLFLPWLVIVWPENGSIESNEGTEWLIDRKGRLELVTPDRVAAVVPSSKFHPFSFMS